MAEQRHDPEQRPSPEALLEAARREQTGVGKLRIFVGAAPGVGKTYEMLQQARARKRDGKVVGSALIGQVFADDKYFHGRPSATVTPDPKDASKNIDAPYTAANSGGSNLGPTNQALKDRVAKAMTDLKTENPSAAVPIDLVTTSGSGLDPDISPEAALFQVPRVAKARNMPEERLRQLVANHIEGRTLGLLGEPRVNVLALNLALDQASK